MGLCVIQIWLEKAIWIPIQFFNLNSTGTKISIIFMQKKEMPLHWKKGEKFLISQIFTKKPQVAQWIKQDILK